MQDRQEERPVEKREVLPPGAFASQEEFDAARHRFECYLAMLKEWKKNKARGLAVSSRTPRDLPPPSLN